MKLRNAVPQLRKIRYLPYHLSPPPPKKKRKKVLFGIKKERSSSLMPSLTHGSIGGPSPVTRGVEGTTVHVMLPAVEILADPRELLISIARPCPRCVCTTPSMAP